MKNYVVSKPLALEADECKNGVDNCTKNATNDQYCVQRDVGVVSYR